MAPGKPCRHPSAGCLFLLALLAAAPCPTRAAAVADSARAWAQLVLDLGLENVAVVDSGARAAVLYENRRWRHSADALGHVAGAIGVPLTAFEERLGLPAAAITRRSESVPLAVELEVPARAPSLAFGTVHDVTSPERTRFRVRYPFEPDFPAAPRAAVERPTWRSADLVLGALVDYELGRIYDPVLYRIQLQPTLRYNPWPGALARLAVVIPVRNRYDPDPQHPDLERVRPGLAALEQFTWIPRTGLLSVDAGYFGDNRYGGVIGLARPLAGGRFLLDAEGDLTGFIAFGPGGTQYSDPSHLTGYGAVTWRPGLDLSVRGRVARFLYGDDGVELEVRRAFGDFDIAFFGQRTAGVNIAGVRLVLPVPPMQRAAGTPLRLQPIERFAIDYHSEPAPLGRDLTGTGSRAEYLRQLDEPALDANLGRFARAENPIPAKTPSRNSEADRHPDLINLTGVTGFVNTPWAGVVADRRLEAGYNHIPRTWAYDHRGTHNNEVYYLTLGFLPRAEASVRWTVLPGLKSFTEEVPGSPLTDTDYMASGRISLVAPRPNRPGLALGIEDVKGTRRFHSEYAVTGLPWQIGLMQGRLSIGYAFDVLGAARRTLDGTFGAFEWSPWRRLATQVEYDSEKWNLGVAVPAPFGIRFRAAWLHMQSFSVGAGLGCSL